MLGLMQDWPLLVHRALDHAAQWHGEQEIVSRAVEGEIHRYTYEDAHRRARKLASSVETRLGIKAGDIVATMAWNTYRHLEIWYGVMSTGAVVHTLNPRLFAEQLVYIINHAQDKWIFVDLTFIPILENIADRLPTVKGFIIMTDKQNMPDKTSLPNVICYEELLHDGDENYQWPEFPESTACGMCYTSGTTGNPKGVVYSHRSNILHGMSTCSADALGISSRDIVMPVVPMFHANAWSLAFSSPIGGAGLVMPGGQMDGESIYQLLDQEKVTITAAVPTVWLLLLQYLEANPQLKLDNLQRVVIGGSACPEAMMKAFEDKYNTQVIHAWGMTEMSPLGSLGTHKAATVNLPNEEWWPIKLKQGRPPFTVEMKVTDDEDNQLPADGEKFGRLKVRGPSVAKSYYKGEGATSFDDQGWFDTGDVSTIDRHGYMQITDRSKDVIKSGGEWISSIDLENIAMGCEGVLEAAAIGLAHPKWDERPLLVVVKHQDAEVTPEAILAYMEDKIAKWWLPDDIAFIDEIPHTATGKISKLELRNRFKDYKFPNT